MDDGDGGLTETTDFGHVFVIGDSADGTIAHHLTVGTSSVASNLVGARLPAASRATAPSTTPSGCLPWANRWSSLGVSIGKRPGEIRR